MNTPILPIQMNQAEKSLGDSYLKFHLDLHTIAILAMEHVQEVLIVPSTRVSPMPNMPEFVLGLLNRRNRIFWVIDLAPMLSFQPPDTTAQQYNVVILRVGEIPLGLLVEEVKGLTRISPDLIQPPLGLVTPVLIPYIHGCVLHKQEPALVLNAEAIVHSPLLNGD